MNMVKQYEFEQLPRESAKAFAAFRVYLELGAQRSLATVAGKLGKSKVLMERWSRKYDWGSRVAAYSSHLATVEREATEAMTRASAVLWEERSQKLREQTWAHRERLCALAETAVKRFLDQAYRTGTLEGIARVYDLISILGHRATGVPLQRVEVTGEGGGPVRLEFEMALKKVYGKVVEAEVVETRDQRAEGRDQKGSPVACLPEKAEGK